MVKSIFISLFILLGNLCALAQDEVTPSAPTAISPTDIAAVKIFKESEDPFTKSGRFNTDVGACRAAQEKAFKFCLESTNVNLIKGGTLAVGLISAAEQFKLVDQCSQLGKAMDVASAAAGIFAAECSYFKKSCESACNDAKAAVAKKPACATNDPSCPNELKNASTFTGLAIANCTGYEGTILAAGVSILKLLAQQKQATGCDNANRAQTAAPTEPDCKDPKFATTPDCICKANPFAPKCPDAPKISKSPTGVTTLTESTPSGSSSGATAPFPSGMGSSSGSGISMGGGSGDKSALGPSGGGDSSGGGGFGTSGSGSGRSGDRGLGSKSALNGNTIGGDWGGGGGGSGYRSSSDRYAAFMPGGKKDPTRNAASVATKTEITGAGGEDNFKKVKSRYIESRGSLIGD